MKIKTSSSFRKKALKTVFSIVAFILIYIFLLVAALGLVIACIYVAFMLLASVKSFVILVFGITLIASSVTVLIYLIKVIFSSEEEDNSNLLEITAFEEPQLFTLIEDIAKEVGTSNPKKVYLAYDANACVFYNTNFWSIFMPIRKNLQIGVGLINSVSIQELKAIIGHELGHFSQRSMRLGTFVYSLNQIIYNMLYNNKYWDSMNERWSQINRYAAFFIGLAIYIIKGIKKILQHQYANININYMALSREMEFQADEIAAHVAGSKALIESLLRLPYASAMLDYALTYYEDRVNQNIKSENIYADQLALIQFFAHKNGFLLQEGLPIITLEQINKYKKSKLNLSNQWSSHPTDEERIAALTQLAIRKENTCDTLASVLLNKKINHAKVISDELFASISFTHTPLELSTNEFITTIKSSVEKDSFSPLYNQYFDFSDPLVDEATLLTMVPSKLTFEDLFKDSNVDLINEVQALEQDMELITAIDNKQLLVKTFDYAGIKYNRKQAKEVLKILYTTILEKEAQIKQHKNEIFRYFYFLAKNTNKEEKLCSLYFQLTEIHKVISEKIVFYENLISKTSFITERMSFDAIETNFNTFKEDESRLKKEIKLLLLNPSLKEVLDNAIVLKLEEYTQNDLIYFNTDIDQYNVPNVETLLTTIRYYHSLNTIIFFNKKKELLDFQISLIA